jgi:hypothetical protein
MNGIRCLARSGAPKWTIRTTTSHTCNEAAEGGIELPRRSYFFSLAPFIRASHSVQSLGPETNRCWRLASTTFHALSK